MTFRARATRAALGSALASAGLAAYCASLKPLHLARAPVAAVMGGIAFGAGVLIIVLAMRSTTPPVATRAYALDDPEQDGPAWHPEPERSPYLDYAGHPIREGDTIRHPDGETGTVLFWRERSDPFEQWRVDYNDGHPSRLFLQVGEKGLAVVVPDAGVSA